MVGGEDDIKRHVVPSSAQFKRYKSKLKTRDF